MRKNVLTRFINKNTLPLVLASAAALFSAEQAQAQYVHTDGTKIVDGSGKPLFLTGANLGNWLVWEGYLMVGDNWDYRTHSQLFNSLKMTFGNNMDQAMDFEHKWRLNYVNEQMIKDLKDKGYNSVRVPFNYKLFWNNGAVSNTGFQYIDQLVTLCRKYNIYILLDMHGAPGYQNPGDHSDNVDAGKYNKDTQQDLIRATVNFWQTGSTANVDIAAQVWRHIASHYSNEPIIWGYDLINEPVPQEKHKFQLLPSLIKMRDAIRQVDGNHTIVAEASWWASDFQPLDWTDATTQSQSRVYSRWDNNLVYQTHHYPGKESEIADMYPRVDLTNRLGVPLIVGEVGETSSPEWLRTEANWAGMNTAGYFPWTAKKMKQTGSLWTVNTNAAYESVMAAIKQNPTAPVVVPGAAQNMISFAQSNILNGQSSVTWNQEFYDSVRLKANTPNLTGRYYLKNRKSGLVLHVTEASNANGALLQQWNITNGTNQQFDLVDNGNGAYAIKNVNSGKVLDIGGVSQTNGAQLQQWESFGAANQLFILSKMPNEKYYQIIAKHSGKVMEVRDGSVNASTVIQQWADNNQPQSQWELVPVVAAMNYKRQAEDFSGSSSVVRDYFANDAEDPSKYVGWIDAFDWMAYSSVTFPVSGYYTFSFRVASPYTGKNISIDLNAGSIQLGKLPVTNTGDWQKWATVSKTGVWVNAGTYSVGISTDTGGWNINWFRIVKE